MKGVACAICGCAEHDVLYRGPIRVGRFGHLSAEPHTIWRCGGCCAGYLPAPETDYESGAYRTLVDGGDTAEDFYRLHDGEQAEKLRLLGTEGLRGAVLMDVGCGAGSFLDLVKGVCRVTIGIEPTASLRQAVVAKGHVGFPYCSDAAAEWEGRVDVAALFSVIEHVPDPKALLHDIRRLLRPGGRLLLSTPNRRDWLLDVLPDDYAPFFYRLVHTWYFDADAMRRLAELAGFAQASVFYSHRFDLSNAVLWLRDKRPTGLGKLDLPGSADSIFRATLEGSGRADYLYCSCTNG